MFTVRLAGDHLYEAVYLAVAGGVFDGALLYAVLFPRDVLDEIWD